MCRMFWSASQLPWCVDGSEVFLVGVPARVGAGGGGVLDNKDSTSPGNAHAARNQPQKKCVPDTSISLNVGAGHLQDDVKYTRNALPAL